MKKQRTISIGGATYDLFVRTSHAYVHPHEDSEAFVLPLGEKIRVEDVVETCGGGADNTAVGLARLGCQAYFSGVMGDDQWGDKLLRNMHLNGVDTSCATIVEGEVTSFSIVLSASGGERVLLYDPGTNAHLHDVTFDREMVSTMDWVFLNHIQEESCVIQDDMINILAAHGGPSLTWNPGGCQLDTGLDAPNNRLLLAHTNLIVMNKQEAMKFTKTDSMEKAMSVLIQSGVKVVCITDGKHGTMATDGKTMYHCPIFSEQTVLDTTGAGDAFGTGMTWAMINGLDLPDCLRAGTINAASVVSAIGAQAGLLTDTEMQQRLNTVHLPVGTSPFSSVQ